MKAKNIKQVDQIKSNNYFSTKSADTIGFTNAEEVASLANVSLQSISQEVQTPTMTNDNDEGTEFAVEQDVLEDATPAESSPESPVPNL